MIDSCLLHKVQITWLVAKTIRVSYYSDLIYNQTKSNLPKLLNKQQYSPKLMNRTVCFCVQTFINIGKTIPN